jgi:nicotinamidase-related amidase
MSIDLRELVTPAHTAVLTMEVQRGVVGDLSSIPALADESANVGLVPNIARVLEAARAHDVRVVHCLAEFRADRAGSAINCALFAAGRRHPEHMLVGSPSAELVPELGPAPEDLISSRVHGISPFIGTSLDTWLRNLGVRTVVATGVSVNLGIFGMAVEALNFGYQVVLPRDAVAGVPKAYADAVLENSLALIATLTSTQDLLRAWSDDDLP